MFLLIMAGLVMFWLLVGAVQFLICVSVPRLRKNALSAALWWAVWGPCSVGLLMLGGLGLVAEQMAKDKGWGERMAAAHLPVALGWGYVVLGMLGTILAATVAAWLHQAVVRRLTFALFRLYAMAVVAAIGSVFGWMLSWVIAAQEWRLGWPLAIAEMLVLVVGFGVTGYRGARALRGAAPERWAVVTREEFEGV